MSLVNLLVLSVGILLIYAAVKGESPVKLVRDAIGGDNG